MRQFSGEYIGDSFVWWLGEVKDVDDPLKLGRVRVLVFNWYSSEISTSDLPWAQPISSINSANLNGVGQSPTGIEVGSWVVGFFLDGQLAQRPVIMGTIGGIPESQGEPDTDRLARNDDDFQPENPTTKNESKTSGVPVANSDETWDEPDSAYAAQYPNNKVLKTNSGHIKEYDDTPDNERIHEYHKSGTFYEIDSNGNKVLRIKNNKYEVVLGDEYINVKGNSRVTINGNGKVYIKGNADVQIDGSVVEVIGGAVTWTTGENVTINGAIITPDGQIITSRGVNLDYHKHPQNPDSDANSQQDTEYPYS